MKPMLPDPEIRVRKLRIPTPGGSIPALLLSPKGAVSEATGILWLHGGGYFAGSKEMVLASRAEDFYLTDEFLAYKREIIAKL